jgi:hypothetical protein
MEMSGQIHVHAALPLRKQPAVPMVRRFGEPQSPFTCYEVEKNILPLPGIEPLKSSNNIKSVKFIKGFVLYVHIDIGPQEAIKS